jgi:hypothetical protein
LVPDAAFGLRAVTARALVGMTDPDGGRAQALIRAEW